MNPKDRRPNETSDHDPEKIKSWNSYYALYRIPSYQAMTPLAKHLDLAKQINERIGSKICYTVRSPTLIQSAFIHPSIPFSWENIPSYQRLEFLGDALHDQVCIQHIYDKYPDKGPQWLTEHKMAMVSNKFLAALAVKLGLHRHLRKNSSSLARAIEDFANDMMNAEEAAKGGLDYWVNISGSIPKALPDCLEAFIGAIFVDTAFDLAVVQRFFEVFVQPYFVDMTIYDTYAGNHPTTLLTTKMKEVGCEDWKFEAEGEGEMFISAVMVHGRIFAHAKASSARSVKVKASAKALEKLEDMGLGKFTGICRCKGARERYRELRARQVRAEKAARARARGMGPGEGGVDVGGLMSKRELAELKEELEGRLDPLEGL